MGHGTLVDLNRAGTPLVEVVGGPDLRSPEEAYVYLNTLKRNLSYLGVSDLNMERGSLRVDANVSIRPRGQEKFGVRSEVKNLNSFRAVRAALEHEIKRHTALLEGGGKLTQETRLWDEEKLETRSLRSKEEATDYRFFPEPDLTTFDVSREWVEKVRATLPEMPEKLLLQLRDDYGLPTKQAEYLVMELPLAKAATAGMDRFRQDNRDHRRLANFLSSTAASYLNENNVSFEESNISTELVVNTAKLLTDGKLNNVTAREVFFEAAKNHEEDAELVARQMNKLVETDAAAVENAINEVLAEFRDKAVADYLRGETKVLGFLIGQVMRKLKGKANPKELAPKLEAVLAELK
jgi:aspartyl-tRNA(Asn)/glutamyl-tRNA(Gln) amidotransferase subunit B